MFNSCCKVFYTITVFWILLWANFQFGMIAIGIIALIWGLTTDHWYSKTVDKQTNIC